MPDAPRLVIAGTGPLGTGLAPGARAAGFRVTCLGPGRAATGPVDVVVLPADGPGADPALPEPAEVAAVALAPLIHAGTLVVVAGTCGLRRCGDVVAGTLGILTGRSAGRDYALGFAAVGAPGGPVVVSGVDHASVERTTALFRALGHPTSVLAPLAEAAFAALARRAAGQPGPAGGPGRGQIRVTARPITAAAGTGPKSRESIELPRSSPRT